MPGNSRSGRKPKQVDIREALDPADRPQRPKTLRPHAAHLWTTSVVPADHLRASDTVAAVTACELYQLWQEALQDLRTEGIMDAERANVAIKYQSAFQRAMQTIAIDPLGRMRAESKTRRKKTEELKPDIRFFGTG